MFQDRPTEFSFASSAAVLTESRPQQLAEITPVPAKDAKVVLSPTNVAIATALILLPIGVAAVGGLGLIGVGLAFANQNQAITAGCVLGGMAVGVLSILVLLRRQHYLASHFQLRVARSAFEKRTGCVVNPGDPNAQFLDVIPRSSFAKWGPFSDVGFFVIDSANRQLRMEGDARRYTIPFESVASCEVEAVRLDSDQWGNDQYFVVVLSVHTDSGLRELPLATKQLHFSTRRMPERQAEAEELCEAIRGAMAG